MPPLAHLSFTNTTFIPVLHPLLQISKLMHVMAFLGRARGNPAFLDLQSDPGFVTIPEGLALLDWHMGAHTGIDHWTRAEEFILRRRSGEIDLLTHSTVLLNFTGGRMNVLSLAPTLPFDLERNIFETCALSRPVLIPNLMLVAWRVKEWVEPLLYRTIAVEYSRALDGYPIFTWDVLLSAVRSKPASFFHYSVHNLCILVRDEERSNMEELLTVCTGVQKLSLPVETASNGYGPETPLLTAVLALTHLECDDPLSIFENLPPAHSLFSHITHLGLRGMRQHTVQITASYLSLMPRLTHLSFNATWLIPVFQPLLENCKSLWVLVYLGYPGMYLASSDISSDPRFVAMLNSHYLLDWQMGAHAGVDYWSRAEDFIMRRWSGEIDEMEYEIIDDASTQIRYHVPFETIQ
ncbi:hypothetical protein B0H19DRAFT_1256565 [Mycena capillaripes]|nr:hypothetical protein B0H19DRAFT_1256565 [Mycena capillaripes]